MKYRDDKLSNFYQKRDHEMGNFINLIEQGGIIMIPLIVCSFLIWAVAFEKFWMLLNFKKKSLELHNRALKLAEDKKFHEARGLCHNVNPLIGIPYGTLLEQKELSRDVLEARLFRRTEETKLGLRKYLWILGTIGASAPFIGLFGTVVGIIKSFDAIARTGKGGFSVVAAGLSEALIATAAGIIVAVIAVIFYNYFQVQISKISLEFKNRLEDMADFLL